MNDLNCDAGLNNKIGNLVLLGLSHKTAPVETRELLSLPQSQIPAFYERLIEAGVEEAVYVSTCNRVEIYMTAEDCESAIETIKKLMEYYTRLPHDAFMSSIYTKHGTDVVKHLLSVTASLDSMVVGENEITGQIKGCFSRAVECGVTGSVLTRLFHRAFKTAKRVKTETGISKNPLSIASIAVERAKKIFHDFSDKSVLLVGAGEMGELILKYLIKDNLSRIVVANRTVENAQKVCLDMNFEADIIPLAKLDKALSQVDIVISSVTAPHHVITKRDMELIMMERTEKPLVIIDIAVPRNVEPSVGSLENVYLHNIDNLKEIADLNKQSRYSELEKSEIIIDEDVTEFLCWYDEQCITPSITALKNKFDEIRKMELQKFRTKKLKHFSEDDYQLVEELTLQIMKKTLHNPIMNLKKNVSACEEAHGHNSVRHSAKFLEDFFTKC
jgi:glutamyl-tRNA reductase